MALDAQSARRNGAVNDSFTTYFKAALTLRVGMLASHGLCAYRGQDSMQIADANAPPEFAPFGPDSKLSLDQLRLALRNLRPNAWLMPIFATIMCVMFARWVPVAKLGIWWSLVTLGGIPLGVVCTKFLREPEGRISQTSWVRHATRGYALFAVSWASMGYFLWVPGNDSDHMIVLLVLGCTLAGNAALIGASLPLTIIGLTTYSCAMVLSPLQEGGMLFDGLALMALLYSGYLAHLSRQLYSTARDMFLLRDDKNDLILALARAKVDSDGARQRAEAASLAKSQFLANMSHELRTPLNAILGFSEMINSGHFTARNEEYARLIHDSGFHLLALINDILDLAKIEAGGLSLQEADVDIAQLLADCVSLMAACAEAGEVNVSVNIAPDLPFAFVDERSFKQIVLNLLSNAVKFTPAGGRVKAHARIEQNGEMSLTVSDTGIGIAEEDHRARSRILARAGTTSPAWTKAQALAFPSSKGSSRRMADISASKAASEPVPA